MQISHWHDYKKYEFDVFLKYVNIYIYEYVCVMHNNIKTIKPNVKHFPKVFVIYTCQRHLSVSGTLIHIPVRYYNNKSDPLL